MDVRHLLIELAEKIGLLATAALVAVLVPPLRNRLLGVGQRRDKLVALLLGVALSLWGAKLGQHWLGENINVRAIGIFMAAVLGGRKAGATAGLCAGLFFVARVEPTEAPWGVIASALDGALAGIVAHRAPHLFYGGRAFLSCCAIQGLHLGVVGAGMLVVGQGPELLAAWPAHVVMLIANAAGFTFFVVVARIVMAREEAAVALVEARAAADAAALEALRRRLEPHFLFNALNTLRATIRTNPSRARELVSDLADLYRYLLAHPEDARVQDEVSHAYAYLNVERARLGDERLRVDTSIEEDVAHVRVPALLLQPLVENAVKHGVAPRAGGGRVRIAAQRADEELVIRVEDAGEGEHTGTSRGGSGIALETLRKRLEKRFGERGSLVLEHTDSGTRATVRLPWRAVADAQNASGETDGDADEQGRTAA